MLFLSPPASSPSPQEVSEFTAKAERYVGVTSGGMDQAISVMGMPGIAKLVEFNPVRVECVWVEAVCLGPLFRLLLRLR